jgi:hypothetical protein
VVYGIEIALPTLIATDSVAAAARNSVAVATPGGTRSGSI